MDAQTPRGTAPVPLAERQCPLDVKLLHLILGFAQRDIQRNQLLDEPSQVVIQIFIFEERIPERETLHASAPIPADSGTPESREERGTPRGLWSAVKTRPSRA